MSKDKIIVSKGKIIGNPEKKDNPDVATYTFDPIPNLINNQLMEVDWIKMEYTIYNKGKEVHKNEWGFYVE